MMIRRILTLLCEFPVFGRLLAEVHSVLVHQIPLR
jgi:hypothetical protein